MEAFLFKLTILKAYFLFVFNDALLEILYFMILEDFKKYIMKQN
jgi:hypothetical protein